MNHGVIPAVVVDGTRSILAPLARLLARRGVHANAVTVVGVIVTLAGAVVVAGGQPLAGGLVLLAGTLADALDGQLARASGGGTRFGAFLDSTLDRVADGALAGAAIWLGHSTAHATLVAWSLALFLASSLVPYVRAKAETLGLRGDVGIAPREARVALYIIGVLIWAALADQRAFEVTVAVITLLTSYTLVERVRDVARALKNEGKR